MKVNFHSEVAKLRQLVHDRATNDTFRNIHDGLTALKSSVESIALQAEVPGGKTDGINKNFTVKNMPSMVSVNGAIQPKSSWSYTNNTIAFKSAPAASATIESYYI